MILSHTSGNGYVLFRLQDNDGMDIGELRLAGGNAESLREARVAVTTMECVAFYLDGLLDALKGTIRRRADFPQIDSVTLTAFMRGHECGGRHGQYEETEA